MVFEARAGLPKPHPALIRLRAQSRASESYVALIAVSSLPTIRAIRFRRHCLAPTNPLLQRQIPVLPGAFAPRWCRMPFARDDTGSPKWQRRLPGRTGHDPQRGCGLGLLSRDPPGAEFLVPFPLWLAG